MWVLGAAYTVLFFQFNFLLKMENFFMCFGHLVAQQWRIGGLKMQTFEN